MAHIVSQGPCPSPYHAGGEHSDAYTIYDDGSSHCFNCGYHIPANSYKVLEQLTSKVKVNTIETCPPLPEDCYLLGEHNRGISTSKTRAWAWLHRYDVNEADWATHHFMWSEEKQLLIFPVFSETYGLLIWQGRYFGDAPRHPKYLTRGLKESVVHVIKPSQDNQIPLVLVEDLISAIKVGRVAHAVPLWGSYLSKEMAQRLSIMWKEVYLWLDYDKREESTKQSIQHCMRLDIKPIITSLDPKAYSDVEIKEILKAND